MFRKKIRVMALKDIFEGKDKTWNKGEIREIYPNSFCIERMIKSKLMQIVK